MSVPSFAWLQWVSKLVLQVVPPVAASVISAYLLSNYHIGGKEASAPARTPSVTTDVASPAPPLAASVIDAEHANALRPEQARRLADIDREPEQIIALPPVAAAMQRIRQGRDAGREPVLTRVSTVVPETPAAAPAPAIGAPVTEAAAADKPQETRVLGVRIPHAVASAGQTIVNVGVEQPARLVGAGLDLGRRTIDALASILPESRR